MHLSSMPSIRSPRRSNLPYAHHRCSKHHSGPESSVACRMSVSILTEGRVLFSVLCPPEVPGASLADHTVVRTIGSEILSLIVVAD